MTSNASTADADQIVWGFEREFSGYNLTVPEGGTLGNLMVLERVLEGFYRRGPDGSLIRSTDFGTYRKVSDKPLTVEYTFSDKAVWSDGVPIGCEDVMLAWLAANGTTGTKGFDAGTDVGLGDAEKPQCAPGGKIVKIIYRGPYADWETQFGVASLLPAHIVAQQGGLTKSWSEYADTPASPELAKAIEFFNHGWTMKPGELKKDLMPSSGPYRIESWTAGQSLTLTANPRWWGRPAKTKKIVIRYIAGTGQVQALQNGEIQAMDPEPQVDLLKQLEGLGETVNVTTGTAFRYEHLDFNFRGVFKDRTVREAFARCVPRQKIVDNLIKPQNPKAEIQQSRFIFPFQPQYPDFKKSVGGEKYDQVDLEGAKRLLAGRRPAVRLGWDKSLQGTNKRRADTVLLIQASCSQAGFDVVDAGTPTFLDKEWLAANYDVALFGWSGSPSVIGQNDRFQTNTGKAGGSNTMGYSNPEIDRLFKEQSAELDTARQIALAKQIDTVLWQDLATIPLFANPGLLATSKDVRGLEYNPTLYGLAWNMEDWTRI